MKITTLFASAAIAAIIAAVLLWPAAGGQSSANAQLQQAALPPLPPKLTPRQESFPLPIVRRNNAVGAQQTPVVTPAATKTPARQLPRAPFFKRPVRPVNVRQLMPRKFDDKNLLVKLFAAEGEGVTSARTFDLRGQPMHYLTLELVVQIDSDTLRPSVELAEGALADHLTAYLLTRTIEDAHKTSEMMKLKEIILLFLNDYLPAGGVRAVYFSSYLIN